MPNSPSVRRRTLALVWLAIVGVVPAGVSLASAPTSTDPSPEPTTSEFCAAGFAIRDAAAAIDEMFDADPAGPAAVEDAYVDLADATAEAAALAPAELADGLHDLAGQASIALAIVAANDFDLTDLDDDPRWVALRDYDRSSGMAEQELALEEYVEANCADIALPPSSTDLDEMCAAGAEFSEASDAFGAIIADEDGSPDVIEAAFDDYLVAIDELFATSPPAFADWLDDWRAIVVRTEAIFESNDWDVVESMLDPDLVTLQDDVAELEDSGTLDEYPAMSCDGIALVAEPVAPITLAIEPGTATTMLENG